MSESISEIIAIDAPVLQGAWLHHVSDPAGTIEHFRYTNDRKRSLSPVGSLQWAVGRELPIPEYGENLDDRLSIRVLLPYEDDYAEKLQWWYDAAVSRDVICYRDNRGRVLFTSLVTGITEEDARIGVNVSAALPRIDYSEAI